MRIFFNLGDFCQYFLLFHDDCRAAAQNEAATHQFFPPPALFCLIKYQRPYQVLMQLIRLMSV